MSDHAVYTEEQVRRWLGFLAHNMQSRSLTIFLIEGLQPTWSGNRLLLTLYFVISRCLVYVIAAVGLFALNLASFYADGTVPWHSDLGREMLVFNAISTIIFSIACMSLEIVLTKLRTVSKPKILSSSLLIRSLAWAFFIGQVSLLFVAEESIQAPAMARYSGGLLSCVSCAILDTVIAVNRSRRPVEDDIKPVERISWSWMTFWKSLSVFHSWVVAVPVGLLVLFGIWARDHFEAVLGLGTLVCGWLLVRAANKAFDGGEVPLKTKPNSGIWLSFRSAGVVLGIVMAVAGGMVSVEASSWTARHKAGVNELMTFQTALQIGMVLVPPFALSRVSANGGVAFVDHFVLRGLLALFGYAPFRYVRFLDYAANRLGFLQTAGGGYVFMHRNLMEYFGAEAREETLV